MYRLDIGPGKMSARPSGSGIIDATDAVGVNATPNIPTIRLKEYELLSSSVVQQAKYSIGVAAGNFEKIISMFWSFLKKKHMVTFRAITNKSAGKKSTPPKNLRFLRHFSGLYPLLRR